jgi:hypothetical protein
LTTSLLDSTTDRTLAADPAVRADPTVREYVREILSRSFKERVVGERRLDQRYPYPNLIPLIPVDENTLQPIGEPLVVVGKHLSQRGLDFFHNAPIPYRKMIAQLTTEDGPTCELLLDLTWCRFVGGGWYDNGGTFTQVVDRDS